MGALRLATGLNQAQLAQPPDGDRVPDSALDVGQRNPPPSASGTSHRLFKRPLAIALPNRREMLADHAGPAEGQPQIKNCHDAAGAWIAFASAGQPKSVELIGISPNPVYELKVLDKRILDWGLPRFQTEQSAGIDLFACVEAPITIHPQAPATLIPSGIAVQMNDPNVVAFLLARSGLGHKKGLILGQSVGTIDADYTNQIFISAWLRTVPGSEPVVVAPGDRIAQLVFLPILRPTFKVVEEFSVATGRGQGGFGSTGVQGGTQGETPR